MSQWGNGYSEVNDDAVPNFVVAANNGFRAWSLEHAQRPLNLNDPPPPCQPEAYSLRSVVQNYEWTPGINRAKCMKMTPEAVEARLKHGLFVCQYPSKHCQCGFYAYYEVDRWTQGLRADRRWPEVHGMIAGWGRCVVGSLGFRAENALILGLVIPQPADISKRWLVDRTPEEGRDEVEHILRVKFPMIPLYDTVGELLANTPLNGRPR